MRSVTVVHQIAWPLGGKDMVNFMAAASNHTRQRRVYRRPGERMAPSAGKYHQRAVCTQRLFENTCKWRTWRHACDRAVPGDARGGTECPILGGVDALQGAV